MGFDPWIRKIFWRRNGNPLQYSCLENPMDGRAWWAIVHGVAKSRTRLSCPYFILFQCVGVRLVNLGYSKDRTNRGGLPLCFVIYVIKGDRTMSLMSPAMYYSSLFWELSRMEEFRNRRNIENRCVLQSQESPLPPDYTVRM